MGMVLDIDDSNNDDSNINPIRDGPFLGWLMDGVG